MKTALITGHKGFVGSHFHQHLAGAGYDVTGIDIEVDVRTFFKHERTQFDLVVHAAAAAPNRKAIDDLPAIFPYNVQLDASLFEWVQRTAQPRVVYLSSCAVYPKVLQTMMMQKGLIEEFVGYDQFYLTDSFPFGLDPTPYDTYGWTKLIGEHMARAVNKAGGTTVTVVRPFSGYGSYQSDKFPFRAFMDRAINREDPFKIWGTGLQVRDWIHIWDVVRGTMALVDAKSTRPVNLCTGIGTSMIQLVDKITKAVGYEPIVSCDTSEPNGADFRVGNPAYLNEFYTPRISIDEGIDRALKGYS